MTTETTREALMVRAKSYIQRKSQQDPSAIRGAVIEGQTQLLNSLDGMSRAQATFKPADDVWCVLEVLSHVITAKGGVARICERLGRGETVAGFGPEGERRQDGVTRETFASLEEARSAVEAAHEELMAFVDQRLSAADLEARYNHFVFGDLNCREWAAFQRVHDGDHSMQIEQVKASAGYPA